MKIYIDNFNLDILNTVMSNLEQFCTGSETYIEAYTDCGIYQITHGGLYQLKPVDFKYSIHKNFYNDFTLIVDPSYFNKEEVTSIVGHIIHNKTIKKHVYKMNKISKLSMVIEGNFNATPEHPLHPKFNPNNIYFEIDEKDSGFQVTDPFSKNEITEFLSALN